MLDFFLAEGSCFYTEEKLLLAKKCCSKFGLRVFAAIAHLDCNCLDSVFVQAFHYSEYRVYFVTAFLGSFLLLGCICQHSEGC